MAETRSVVCDAPSRAVGWNAWSPAWPEQNFLQNLHTSAEICGVHCVSEMFWKQTEKNNRRDTWYMQKTVLCSKKYWRTLWVGRNSLMGPIPHSPSVRMRNCSPHVYISVINVYPSPKAGYDWNCPFFFSFLSDMQWGINVSSVSGLFWLLSFDYMVRFWSGKKKKRRKTKMYFYPLSMSKPSRVISVAMLLFYSCCETW